MCCGQGTGKVWLQKAYKRLAKPDLVAFGEPEGKKKPPARSEPKAIPVKKARRQPARPTLTAFAEP